jgi:hypothetical protein
MEKSTTSAKNQQRADKRAEKKAAKAEEKAAAEAYAAAEAKALEKAKSKTLSVKVDTFLEKVQNFFPEAKISQDYDTGQPNGVKIFINGETIFSVTFFYLENKLNVVFTFDKEAAADDVSSFLTKLKSVGALFMTKKDLETGVIFAVTVKEVLKFFHTIDKSIAVINELIAPPRSIAAPVTDRTFAPTTKPSQSEVSGKALAPAPALAAWGKASTSLTPALAPAHSPIEVTVVEVTPVASMEQKSPLEILRELQAQQRAITEKMELVQKPAEAELRAKIEKARYELEILEFSLENLNA